jgi:hypothetical protein
LRFWLGILLTVTGGLSLILNEFTVNVRRAVKPWWRDDLDPVRDREIKEHQRLIVFLGSIISIELGIYLADIVPLSVPVRALIYLSCGLWLVWRRREFWLALRRGKSKE